MEKTILFGTVVALLLFSGVASAINCAQSAYSQSCASCLLPDGKMDQKCYQEKKNSGIACVSTSHAIASAAYAAGKCPGIDACASALTTCQAQMATGNDSEDCKEGIMAECFRESDACVDKAALDCGERAPDACQGPVGLVLLVVGSIFLFGFARRG